MVVQCQYYGGVGSVYSLNKGIYHFFGLARVSLESFLLRTSTLYLSKSVRLCLLCCLAKDLPIELSANILATFSLAMTFLSFPVLAPLPTLRTCLVSCSLLMGMTCLWMSSPSTRTLLSLRISTIVASLPSRGPQLILATRPTSTNLLYPQITQILPQAMMNNNNNNQKINNANLKQNTALAHPTITHQQPPPNTTPPSCCPLHPPIFYAHSAISPYTLFLNSFYINQFRFMQKVMIFGKSHLQNISPPYHHKLACPSCNQLNKQIAVLNLHLSSKQEQMQKIIENSESQIVRQIRSELLDIQGKYNLLKRKVNTIQKENNQLFLENTRLQNRLKSQPKLSKEDDHQSTNFTYNGQREGLWKKEKTVEGEDKKIELNMRKGCYEMVLGSEEVRRCKQLIGCRERQQEERHRLLMLFA